MYVLVTRKFLQQEERQVEVCYKKKKKNQEVFMKRLLSSLALTSCYVPVYQMGWLLHAYLACIGTIFCRVCFHVMNNRIGAY